MKKRLIELEKTNTWLAKQVQEETGLFVDYRYINKILKGQRHPPKIIEAINKVLELEME